MATKIVLVSDDSNFFDYIKGKLSFRKSDELFSFSFDEIPEKLHLLNTSVLIVNSEGQQEQVLDLLNICKDIPIIITAYNEDEDFKNKCFNLGTFDYITLLTSDKEFQARLLPALSVASILEKNLQYREILVTNKFLDSENEVFVNYNYILDRELPLIHSGLKKAVFMAIAPNEKAKFLINSNIMVSNILNNIRKNDILMNFAPNKYFLLLFNVDLATAQNIWAKIKSQFSENIYAGLSLVTNQKKEQLINEVLNKLHEAVNYNKDFVDKNINPVNALNMVNGINPSYSNFKLFRQEFSKKLEQIIVPVFYQVQQKYSGKLTGVILNQGVGDGYGTFYIKGKNSSSSLRISSPGFSKINIDITYQNEASNIDAKRITLEPEELEAGLLEDLLEQFISDYMREK